MQKYIQLNTQYYALMLRYNAFKQLANDYYNAGYIVPLTLITAINRMKIQRNELKAQLEKKEDRFCELFPTELLVQMILTGASIKF